MLPHAILALRNPNGGGEAVAIPVTNFPVLPIGSGIYLYLTNEVLFENYIIQSYDVDNKVGVVCDIVPRFDGETFDEFNEREWKKLEALGVKDTLSHFHLVYPQVIDFGIRFPLPPI